MGAMGKFCRYRERRTWAERGRIEGFPRPCLPACAPLPALSASRHRHTAVRITPRSRNLGERATSESPARGPLLVRDSRRGVEGGGESNRHAGRSATEGAERGARRKYWKYWNGMKERSDKSTANYAAKRSTIREHVRSVLKKIPVYRNAIEPRYFA